MITKKQRDDAVKRSLKYLENINIVLTCIEKEKIEIADFGLGRLDEIGLEIITYINTQRVCAKELILFPNQLCPEHKHPDKDGKKGKEETFRCRWGKVYLYIPGEPAKNPSGRPPADRLEHFTVWHEIILKPGDQYTLCPNTFHWFQAGPQGAVVSEFSTTSIDEADIFSDPMVKRIPEVSD
ncbi:MAG: D-lyxose/D-mannose family sugar isomerase [Actinobacteria bacterium]|nr:D-lyxose/D-mannose family sugar isomerase [Actinomycetota bacterium]